MDNLQVVFNVCATLIVFFVFIWPVIDAFIVSYLYHRDFKIALVTAIDMVIMKHDVFHDYYGYLYEDCEDVFDDRSDL